MSDETHFGYSRRGGHNLLVSGDLQRRRSSCSDDLFVSGRHRSTIIRVGGSHRSQMTLVSGPHCSRIILVDKRYRGSSRRLQGVDCRSSRHLLGDSSGDIVDVTGLGRGVVGSLSVDLRLSMR